MPARLAVAALALACALAIPLRLSADAWAYAAYGALLGHGADPWAHAYVASDIAAFRDPVLDAALRAWNGSLPRDVYGPLFTLPVAAVVAVSRPLGTGAPVFALRLLAALALLACVALAARTRPRLAGLLAFHPVVLWAAAEGHNDVFWLVPVLLADRAGTVSCRIPVLVAAAAVKAIAIVPLISALAHVQSRRRAGFTAASFVVLVAAYAPLWWSVTAHGLDRGNGPPRISLVHAGALAAWSGSPLPLVIGLILGAAGIAALVRAARSGDYLVGAAFAGWLALPAPEPWYAVWLVAVVALARPSRVARALLAASCTGLAGYVQDAVAGTALRDPALLGGTMLALYALPLIVALAPSAPAPQPNAPPPTPPPVVTPAPLPTSTTTPAPPTPTPTPSVVPTPTPSPTASPILFNYIVAPTPGPSGAPQIVEIALNDRVMHKGGWLLVRVTTSLDVTAVFARAMGHDIGIPQGAPGYFAGQQQLPNGIPFFFLNRTYWVEFIASTADGRSASFSLPLRLER